AVVTASFEVKTQGAYEFRLTSDDGAILFVDGRPVVRHDGLHAATARTGSVNLKAGVRAIKVLMFEAQGEQALKLR
ncbi:MAG: PA14 domain-containing protein, partial [Phycisphaerales bacterium]